MSSSRWLIAIAFGGLVIIAAACWYLISPGALTFAGAATVSLASQA